MLLSLNRLVFVIILLAVAVVSWPAHAAAPYQGIYVIMNPYNPVDQTNLAIAGTTPCKAGQQSSVTPFCTAANGIFLRFPWCDFQLSHIANLKGQTFPSCHYVVNFTSGVGSKGIQAPETDSVSPCPSSYDTCAGYTQGLLAKMLHSIPLVNAQRAKAGLPPLNLSIGMYAGIGTPQSIFDTLGYIDVPNSNTANDPNAVQCYRLPIPWTTQYLNSYLAAMDTLLRYIPTQMPAGANIVIVKLAAITSADAEIQMPGQAVPWTAPVDPGPATRGPILKCNNSQAGAQTWLNRYNATPIASQNFSQANETAFGTVAGHVWGTLLNLGLPNVLLSIPTTDGDALAHVDCGVTGASSCQVDSIPSDWSNYYFTMYSDDLFNGGLAYAAAAAAYSQIRAGTFAFPVAQLSVNATDLNPNPITPPTSVSCIINNTVPANDPIDFLNGVSQPVQGNGAALGWQTLPGEGALCSSNQYVTALNNAIAQGSLFEEVETDAAFGNLGQCSPYLTSALTRILTMPPPTNCAF